PDFSEPVVLTAGRHGVSVRGACMHIHKSLVDNFKYAKVWGTSAKHSPQHCGLGHHLHDEDVLQIVPKTVEEQRRDKEYSGKVQQFYDAYHARKKKKAPLKT